MNMNMNINVNVPFPMSKLHDLIAEKKFGEAKSLMRAASTIASEVLQDLLNYRCGGGMGCRAFACCIAHGGPISLLEQMVAFDPSVVGGKRR